MGAAMRSEAWAAAPAMSSRISIVASSGASAPIWAAKTSSHSRAEGRSSSGGGAGASAIGSACQIGGGSLQAAPARARGPARSAHVAGVAEREATGLGPDREAVGVLADRDAVDQLALLRVEHVDLA